VPRPGRFVLALALLARPAQAQSRAAVEQERREFAEWLRSAPLSPQRAVGVFSLGDGLKFGPATAQIPLAGVEAGELSERGGRIFLAQGNTTRALVRGRPQALGAWQLLPSGPAGRTTITVFAPEARAGKPPSWFPYDSSLAFRVTLTRPATPGSVRVLAPEGNEVEATEAGSVSVKLGGKTQILQVRRLPGASEEESELEIYFRDSSNGHSSYPAGRFVALLPAGGDRFVLDFNRARNPFCAYNTAYPCPAPWRGNGFAVAVPAGERYSGGGLTPTPEP
jgi:uncharacterized protein DUF1684